MVAEKDNERSGTAMSALVRAMARRGQAAVLLFVPRVSEATGGNAAICVARPLLARGSPRSLPLCPFEDDNLCELKQAVCVRLTLHALVLATDIELGRVMYESAPGALLGGPVQ